MIDHKALASALDWEWEFVRDVQNSNPNPGIAKAGVDMVHLVFAAARERLAQLENGGAFIERVDGRLPKWFEDSAMDEAVAKYLVAGLNKETK